MLIFKRSRTAEVQNTSSSPVLNLARTLEIYSNFKTIPKAIFWLFESGNCLLWWTGSGSSHSRTPHGDATWPLWTWTIFEQFITILLYGQCSWCYCNENSNHDVPRCCEEDGLQEMWFCINGKKATDAACQNCPKFFIDYENDFGHKNIMLANVCTIAGNEKGKTKTLY